MYIMHLSKSKEISPYQQVAVIYICHLSRETGRARTLDIQTINYVTLLHDFHINHD